MRTRPANYAHLPEYRERCGECGARRAVAILVSGRDRQPLCRVCLALLVRACEEPPEVINCRCVIAPVRRPDPEAQ